MIEVDVLHADARAGAFFRNRRRLLVALCGSPALALAATPRPTARPAPAADRFAVAGTSEAEVRPFLAALQTAVADNDQRAVGRLFFYPSKVWDGRQSFPVLRRRDLSEHYGAIFDTGLKQAIAQARIDTLFANWQGVALGDGRLWFARITTQGRLAVTGINPPTSQNG